MYQEACPYCNIHADAEQEIVLENETCYFIQKESEQQVLQGSGLIIPKQHKQNVFELSHQEWKDSGELLLSAKELLDKKYSPGGYSVGWNTGIAGGQSDSAMNRSRAGGLGIGLNRRKINEDNVLF